MAKSMSLSGDDLIMKSPNNSSASPQRGETQKQTPSAELVPMQFRMSPEFVDQFKAEALRRRLKLNGMLKYCFAEMLKHEEAGK
jgi:hypothetical protein